MGTRGAFGVRIDGKDKITYNQYDSYPEGLGDDIVEQIAPTLQLTNGIEDLREAARKVKVVDDEYELTDEEKQRLKRFHNPGVDGGQSLYAYLRGLQGQLATILFEAQIMIDASKFVNDSLFCEHAYVVNLDDEVFEIYKGFQKRQHASGRYSTNPGKNGYYPVALEHTIPLDENLRDNFDKWLEEKKREAEEEVEDEDA